MSIYTGAVLVLIRTEDHPNPELCKYPELLIPGPHTKLLVATAQKLDDLCATQKEAYSHISGAYLHASRQHGVGFLNAENPLKWESHRLSGIADRAVAMETLNQTLRTMVETFYGEAGSVLFNTALKSALKGIEAFEIAAEAAAAEASK